MTGRVCVFCGSRPGTVTAHRKLAEATGAAIAARGLGLVYGASTLGLMGAVAEAATAGGAEVIGVLPASMDAPGLAQPEGATVEVVASLAARKERMATLADGFLVLPGGLGTLDELAEMTTWHQLGIADKPVVVLDPGGFWSALGDQLARMVEAGYADAGAIEALTISDDLDTAVDLAARTRNRRPG